MRDSSLTLFRAQTTIQMRCLLLALLAVPACAAVRDTAKTNSGTDSVAASAVGVRSTDSGQQVMTTVALASGTAGPGGAAAASLSAEIKRLRTDPAAPIRGLYVNRFAAQSTKKMRHLIGIADSTEINAFVIDIKDEFGLNFHSTDPLLQKNEGATTKVSDLKALVDTLNAHGILPIARIVVFKDSVAARANPEHTIRKADGSAWRDKKGLTWVNPYANAIWEYNFRVAEEAIRMGFGEIQFDYIRFPEPYKSLPPQVFPESNGRTKTQALAEFLNAANKRIDKYGVRTTADIFGLVTTVNGALEVGQAWEPLTKAVDVLPADGLSVALSARLVRHQIAERRAVQRDPHRDLPRARAQRRGGNHGTACSPMATGIHAWRSALRTGGARAGEARGL